MLLALPDRITAVRSRAGFGRACIVSGMVGTNNSSISGDSGEPTPDHLMPFVYHELHQIAQRLMRGERSDHTLQATALVHEAYVRLLDKQGEERYEQFEGSLHFKRAAVRAMRHALIDHARAHQSEKRGGGRRQITFNEELHAGAHGASSLLLIDEALARLEEVDEQLARIAELRFFGGASQQEIADALGTSLRSIERGWRLARAWLIAAFAED